MIGISKINQNNESDKAWEESQAISKNVIQLKMDQVMQLINQIIMIFILKM